MTIKPIITQYEKEDEYAPYYAFTYPNENSPIFLDVNQSDARLVLTRPADWSNLFITYSMDTDYWFHDFNISHFKQFLYEFERVRSIFTNVE